MCVLLWLERLLLGRSKEYQELRRAAREENEAHRLR